jgi:hypothetical protein
MSIPTPDALLQFVGLKPALFAPNSRYQTTPVAVIAGPDGEPLQYLRRRFLPQPSRLSAVQQHTVLEGDRLDVLAARFFGDPELFWRICEGNAAMRPEDLTAEPGRVLRICLPEGISGGPGVP